jgi:hypothetical protein
MRSIPTSGFCGDGDDICALLAYYAASSGNRSPTFRDNVSAPSFLFLVGFFTLEDGADMLSRNVRKGLPLEAA